MEILLSVVEIWMLRNFLVPLHSLPLHIKKKKGKKWENTCVKQTNEDGNEG